MSRPYVLHCYPPTSYELVNFRFRQFNLKRYDFKHVLSEYRKQIEVAKTSCNVPFV